MTIKWQWADVSHRVVVRTNADGSMESHTISEPSIATFLAGGGTSDAPPAPSPAALLAQAIAAGCQIVSTATPALGGTYAITDAMQQKLQAIVDGISAGKGLPHGAATVQWPDVTG